MVKKKYANLAVTVFSALCVLGMIGWLIYSAISPARLHKQAVELLGREDVVAQDSLHAPWMFVDANGLLYVKRERVRGDVLVIPDVMDGVAVTGVLNTVNTPANGIREISFPAAVDSIDVWRAHYPDLVRVTLRSGSAVDENIGLYRITGADVEVCLPRDMTALDSKAFTNVDASTVIRYEGTETEWLAYGSEAVELAADYTVYFDGDNGTE